VKSGYQGHGRLVLLFLVAVILPSLALVFFALRMIGQERELAEKRLLDDRSRLAADIGRFLLLRLENIKLRQTAGALQLGETRDYRSPEVVLVCRVIQNRLLLPWENDAETEEFSGSQRRTDFSRSIRSGETEEFKNKNPKSAAEYFGRALNFARGPTQKSYARLLLARALAKAGEIEHAARQYRAMLESPSSPKDEYGIHFSLYACRSLLELGESRAEVLKGLTVQLQQKRWHSPSEAYLLKDILVELEQNPGDQTLQPAVETAHKEVDEYLELIEQVQALQRDFEALRLVLSEKNSSGASKSLWALYGESPVLVNLSEKDADSENYLIAVDAGRALASAFSELGGNREWRDNVRLIGSRQPGGIWLGPSFPNVRIGISNAAIPKDSRSGSIQRSFYWFALLLILCVTLFGSYIVWRDLRRELQMAEMRSQFVSSVSHELKTPLTAIRMFAETLSLGRSRNPDTKREYLETIVNESERLTRLLNNVLDFSKIEMGRMVYRLKPTSLPDIVRTAARTVQYPLNQQGFRLKIDIEDGMPDALVDQDAIEQAILNLLSNAMKYSGDARTIDLSLTRHDGDALIRVADHGIGMNQQELSKIFGKFYRVNSQENERITGTGLGLALVDHVVKAHQGRITVESTLGNGSAFSIYLPLETLNGPDSDNRG